jgi:Zn-dependent protease with chaperone function
MFFPFLPFILALAGLTAVLSAPEPPSAQLEAWQVVAAYAALPLIGFLLGHLPESALARARAMRFSPRRIMLLALWLVVVSGLNLYHELIHRLGGLPGAGEIALILLLANYWLSDGLALRPFRPLAPLDTPGGLGALGRTLAISLPALLLFILGIGATWAVGRLWPEDGGQAALPWALQVPLLLLFYAMMMAVAVPLLIRLCWRFRPLPEPEPRRLIHEELEANGIRGTRVYAWPERALGATTAAMIGLMRPFRYMLIGPALVRALTPEELRAVTAHEAAHVRQRHLWYYLAAIFAFILFMQIVMAALVVGVFLAGGAFPVWLGGLIEIAALLLFLRYGIGLLSRHFERQADVHAFRRHGLTALSSALAKVGTLNQIPHELDNWHHYGIGRRVAYLEREGQSPRALAEHDLRVTRLKLAVLGLLALMMAAQPFLATAGRLPGFAERYLAQRLEDVAEPGEAELAAAQYLAALAYRDGDLIAAKHYYRMILDWRPEDPEAQNNLAWLLVTQPRAAPVEIREGVRLAERATEQRQAAYIWDTLAEAYFRAAEFHKAEAAADMALRLAEAGQERGSEPVDYYRKRWKTFSQHPKEG